MLLSNLRRPGSDSPLDPSVKPRLRGVLHQYAFFVSLGGGAGAILVAPTAIATLAASVYAVAVSGLFGASALYHRITWSPRARRWMRRLDHSMIFLLIAGTWTPFALLTVKGTLATVALSVVWGGALLGIIVRLAWIDAPSWLVALLYLALGWAAVFALPQVIDHTGTAATILLFAGGILYSIGAVIYAVRRPDPAPTVFGYHEIFHVLVVLAAAAHYAAVTFFVLPGA